MSEPVERATQAIFCVCADEGVVTAAHACTEQEDGAVFFGEFRDYITADKRPQFSPTLKSAAACVALVDFDKDPELALQTTERLQQIFLKKISIIAVGSMLDASLLLRAMRAGCTEYLSKPVNVDELGRALRRFRERLMLAPEMQSGVGRVIALFGAKGGVGTTILAVHLATFLVRQHGKRVLLIDHKHQLGHVALYLGLTDTRYHFDEMLRNVDRLDVELLNGFVIHHESGLDVIASPETATEHHEGKRDELERVMDFLRREYDYVLIDSSVGYQDSKLSLIDQADEIYLVSTPDVASLRDLARLVESMSLSDLAMSKLRLVLNRAAAEDSLNAAQIQKAVHFPVAISITNNYLELMRAINEGKPVASSLKSTFNQQLQRWSDQIVGSGASLTGDKTAKKKRLAFWQKV
ncbi:MAG TPA: AAA family ATPase [Acidobacteriaceae bacterium]